jgi:hypothetical protein
MMDFLKQLLSEHFGWFAGLAIAVIVVVVGLIVWVLRLARMDRKGAKRELYALATLKRLLFSKESADAVMEDLEKTNTPLDETALPFKAVSKDDLVRTSGEQKG